MFFDDHKKVATIMRGRRDHRGERIASIAPMKAETSKTEDGEADGRHTAMQDFLAAHQEGSALKMTQAMSNFLAIHGTMPSGGESSGSDQ